MNTVIILPTYNERENITTMLESVSAVLKTIPDMTFHILVVDDMSPDGTKDLAAAFQKSHKNIHILSRKKEGLGKALLAGMTYAVLHLKADIIIQMDADMSHDPKVLPQFIQKLKKGNDFVVGSRYIPGGSIPANWGLHRKIYSVIGNTFVRFGLGKTQVHDWTGGYRAFNANYFQKAKTIVSPYSGYVFQIAFLYTSIQNGAHVGEVPIIFTDRRFGRSKIAPLEYIMSIIMFVFSSRYKAIMKGTFPRFAIVGSIGFLINTAILEIFVFFGFHPAMGSASGAEFAIISNFILNNTWTFHARKISGVALLPKFIQFNLAALGGLLIQSGTVLFGTNITGRDSYFPWYIIGVSIGLIWNYIMYSRVIWKSK